MRFRKLKDSYYNAIKKADKEVLDNHGGKRPYVILLDLIYKGKKQTFAVPCRSNIKGNIPKKTYFSLPQRRTTKEGNRHGLHYIKLVPANNKLVENVELTEEASLYLEIINKNKSVIKKEIQEYLDEYDKNNKMQFSTNLDVLLKVYEKQLVLLKSYHKLKIELRKDLLMNNILSVSNEEEINPLEYVIIKNGCFRNYELTSTEIENHKILTINAVDEYGQIKSIHFKVFIRNPIRKGLEIE